MHSANKNRDLKSQGNPDHSIILADFHSFKQSSVPTITAGHRLKVRDCISANGAPLLISLLFMVSAIILQHTNSATLQLNCPSVTKWDVVGRSP